MDFYLKIPRHTQICCILLDLSSLIETAILDFSPLKEGGKEKAFRKYMRVSIEQ